MMPTLIHRRATHFYITPSQLVQILGLFRIVILKSVMDRSILRFIIHHQQTCRRVYRDVLKYVHKVNEYNQGTLLNISNFQRPFPFLYFDLTKQKADIRDGTTKLTFRYELSGTTAAAYSVYALTLYEQEAELIQQNGKLFFR